MADYTQIYGPFYGGMLGKQQLNRQTALDESQQLGILSEVLRRQEQNKLLEEQVNIAKLKAIKENAMLDMFLGGGQQAGATPAQAALAQGAAQGDIGPTVTNAQRMDSMPAAPSGVPGSQFTPQQWTALSWMNPQTSNALMKHQELAQKEREFSNLSAAQREDVRLREQDAALRRQQFGLDIERLRADMMKWSNLSGAERFNVLARATEMRDKGMISPEEFAQIQQAARGGPAPSIQPPQAGPQPQPAPSAGPSLTVTPEVQRGRDDRRLQILMAERESEAAAGNAANVAELDREIALVQGKRPPAAASAQPPQPAVAVSPEKQRELELNRPQATFALRSGISNLDRLETAATKIANDPGLSGITGVIGKFPTIPGSRAANAQAALDTLKNQIFINTLQAMRDASKTGGAVGNVTEKEGARLENAMASLQNAQSMAQMRASLLEIAQIARNGKERLNEAFDATYGRQQQAPSAPTAQPAGRVVDFSMIGRR